MLNQSPGMPNRSAECSNPKCKCQIGVHECSNTEGNAKSKFMNAELKTRMQNFTNERQHIINEMATTGMPIVNQKKATV
jgi:hypothetical protein